MKISGFTIARNVIKFNYPILESILSILPICDEFIVNVGDSEDSTLGLIRSIQSPKIKIIQNNWDMTMGKEVLSYQTNLALKACTGDWAIYLQSDEVIHENDLPQLKNFMERYKEDSSVDCLRFKWLHFYGSYWRYRIDSGWYQKQDRIIKNNGQIESFGDAFSFRRKDGKDLRSKQTGCLLYHYGWVQAADVMARRRKNAQDIGFVQLEDQSQNEYEFGDLNRFPAYLGTHPTVMNDLIKNHEMSNRDWHNIQSRFFWHPALWFRLRYKTGRRVRNKID
jgi:hypothetical protein